MKKQSIRVRLTLVTLAVLTVMAAVLTITAVYGSARIYGAVTQKEAAGEYASDTRHSAAQDENATGYADTGSAGTTVYNPGVTKVYAQTMETAGQQFQLQSLILMVAVIILGSVAAWFVLGFALRPFSRLTAQVEQISAHELHARISGFDTGDELSRLAEAFNHTLERLEQAFAAKQRFSSAAAHELKTPLAAIQANIEVLAVGEKPAPEEYEEVFAATKRQTERMAELVEDLFLISANENYALGDTIALRALAQEVLDEQAGADDITLTLEPGSEVYVQGNAAMLHRVLSNLVENAVKYNKPGGQVALSIAQWDNWAEITVKDTGIGIDSAHFAHIFEPFYRVEVSRSRKMGGSGLGLAIAKDTAERHGGSLQVSSAIGEGSAFRLRLPMV